MKEKGLVMVIYLSLMQITLSSSLSKSKIQRTTAELDTLLSDARPWLYRLALAITAQPEMAEDVAQEALVRAAHSREKLRTADEPKAWLRTVLVRCAINALKRGQPIKPMEEAVLSDPTEAIAVHQVLNRLNPTDRAVLALVYFEQLSYAEIGEMLAIPAGTVGSRLHTARAAFEKEWSK